MKSTTVFVCGFDQDGLPVFSANLSTDGNVTVWASIDNQGMATIYDSHDEDILGFSDMVKALENLAGHVVLNGDPHPDSTSVMDPHDWFPGPSAWAARADMTGQRG